MKLTNQSTLALLGITLGLGLGQPASAQDAPAANPPALDSIAATNLPATTGTIVEDPDRTTNTSESPAARDSAPRAHRSALVVIGRDAVLKAGETAEAVVVIGGTARIQGKVRESVVAVGGDVFVDGGEVGDSAVAVLGSIHARPGSKIHHEAVAVGGQVLVSDGAKVEGRVEQVDFGFEGAKIPLWISQWFKHCVFKLRPLAPQVPWIWGIAGAFFLLYLLIATVLPRPIAACVDQLTERPATTFFLGLLTKLLIPLVLAILALTGIGLIVAPFAFAALAAGAILGKVAIIEWLGFQLGRHFSPGSWNKPVAAFMLGTVLVTFLYLIWVVGLIAYTMLSLWGLGAAVAAAFGSLRRELPPKPTGSPPPAAADFATPGPAAAAPLTPAPIAPAGASTTPPPAETATSPSTPPMALPVPEILNHPKASFWERMGAGFLDVVLVSLISGFVGMGPLGFLVALAYFSGMWTWRGTTIGGIVLGLKIVRLDSGPLTFPVALVRALAAAFSVVVFFLGFLWIAWDREKQGWHDKIAGTAVLRLPRGTPLVCL